MRSRNSTRGRAAVLVGVALFVAVQLGVSGAVNRDELPLRDPIYSQKWDTLKAQPEFFADTCERHRVVAIGSSRTQLSLDAQRLTNTTRTVFNFAAAGCGPISDALYLRRALASGLKCETALVEIHPAMLAEQNPPFEARWLHSYRLRPGEVEVLRSYGWNAETPPQFTLGAELKATHTYRFAILNAVAPKALPCPFGLGFSARTDSRGHIPGIDIPPAERPQLAVMAYQEYCEAFVGYRPGGPAAEAVRDMLTQLKQKGIRPVLLVSPESTTFRSWYPAGSDKALSAWLAELSSEFAAPLIDARGWVPDDQFADAHHTVPAGAITFTDRLNSELGRIGR